MKEAKEMEEEMEEISERTIYRDKNGYVVRTKDRFGNVMYTVFATDGTPLKGFNSRTLPKEARWGEIIENVIG